LKLQTLTESQESKELTVNENMYLLDALLQGVAGQQNTPPGSPNPGDAYIVTATATGAWANQENRIAYYFNGGWSFLIPSNGLALFDRSQSTIIYFSGIWKTFLGSNPVTAETLTNSGTAYVTAGTPSVVPITLTANTTITLPTPPGTGRYSVEYWLYQDNTGGRAVTWASTSGTSIQWDSSFTAPTIATAAQLLTQLEFKIRYPDTRWRGRKVWQEYDLLVVFLLKQGTLTDSSLTASTITLSGASLQTISGKSAVYFNGSSFLKASINSNFDLGSITNITGFTIEFWAYISSNGAIVAHALPGSGGSGVGGWNVAVSGNKLYFSASKNSASGNNWYFYVETSSTITFNSFTHCAVVISNGVPSIYINGSLVGSNVLTPNSIYASSLIGFDTTNLNYGLIFGASDTDSTNPSNGSFFTGYVYDVRICRTAIYTANFTPPTSF
jgi:hypothetical protein